MEHKPQEERLQAASPCPAKGVIGWCERGCRVVVLGNKLDPGSWPDPEGLDSPTFPAHMVAHAAAWPMEPLFFVPACPVLSQALITAAGGLGRDPPAHIMQEP